MWNIFLFLRVPRYLSIYIVVQMIHEFVTLEYILYETF